MDETKFRINLIFEKYLSLGILPKPIRYIFVFVIITSPFTLIGILIMIGDQEEDALN